MTVQNAISALQGALPAANLHTPSRPTFIKLNSSYLSAVESELISALIATPASPAEVSAFMKAVAPTTVPFAIRDAGQCPAHGCANTNGGITLDLSALKGVELEGYVVKIAVGERWGGVYEKLDESGLGVAGGRSGKGGIGGLALQG